MTIDHTYEIYARILALNNDGDMLEAITGRISAGSINEDGASAVRRTCQLTMITDEADISTNSWSFQTRFKLEVGLKTNTMSDIVWRPRGIYIITSFSASKSTTHTTITLSGKDKMCLLNGEIGGTLNAPVDFGTVEENLNGVTSIKSIPIAQIIREMIHAYGHEPYHNILVKDLNENGLELLEYKNTDPLYLIRPAEKAMQYQWMTLNGAMSVLDVQKKKQVALSDLSVYDDLSVLQDNSTSANSTVFQFLGSNSSHYCACRLEYGMCAGYRETPLTYPGELIGNPGETITSILDKIKSALGNFEYFYDEYGRFIFQRINEHDFINGVQRTSATELLSTMRFSDLSRFSSMNIAPNIANIKNDFSIRGVRKLSSGAETPILLRYAIDHKPISYCSISVADNELYDYNKKNNMFTVGQDSMRYLSTDVVAESYYDPVANALIISESEWKYAFEDKQLNVTPEQMDVDTSEKKLIISLNTTQTLVRCDWREIIYQMAIDHSKYGHLDDFEQRVALANPELYPSGRTGYEQYYTDILSFWRDIYNLSPVYVVTTDMESVHYIKESVRQEYEENSHQVRYNDKGEKDLDGKYMYIDSYKTTINTSPDAIYYKRITNENGWNKNIINNPSSLKFWLDFLDNTGELDQYSVQQVGIRPKVETNTNIQAIYTQEVPNIIYYFENEPTTQKSGYTYFKLSEIHSGAFEISTQGKSAYEAINSLLQNYTNLANTITFSSIPMYDLQLHNIFTLDIDDRDLRGDYTITKISTPLSYNSTMSITASKISKQLL